MRTACRVADFPERPHHQVVSVPETSPDRGEPPPPLTVAAVARRLGVAPATLRTWDRRYGLGPTTHARGAHRRYTTEDLARLHEMRRLTLAGVAPADAARLALRAGVTTGTGDAAPVRDGETASARPRGHGGPGGPVLAVPGASSELRGLSRAAMALDAPTMMRIARTVLTRDGVVTTWEQLLRPALAAAGERYAATGVGVDVEHLLSECVIGVLHAVAPPEPALNVRPVLLACAAEEQHALPMHTLRAALAERGVTSRLLGARTPADALVAAVRRVGPCAVVVYAHLPRTAHREMLTAVPSMRPPVAVLAGGPGWGEEHLPPHVERVSSLDDALARVEAALA